MAISEMKIIYGITKSNFGGAQRYVFDLAGEAKKAGHDVSVLTGGNKMLVEKLRGENIQVITIPHLQRDISIINEFKSFYFIFRTLRIEKPDVFHTNSSKMGGIGNLAARLARVRRIIFTGHGWAFNEPWRPWGQKALIKFFAWLTILFSHRTICVSEKTRRDVANWPFIKSKLVVVRNGISSFELKPRDISRRILAPKIEPRTLLVGANSELHKIKGLDILLLSWQKFIKGRDAHLVLISDGEERTHLEDLTTRLGIKSSVTFAGYVDNARAYLPALDIFAMPSRSENLPYAILEAGLAGLPVIATRVGGIPEIIEPSISGALVEPENPEAFFSTLILLAEDKELREHLGRNLKTRVEKEFPLDRVVLETFAIYLR